MQSNRYTFILCKTSYIIALWIFQNDSNFRYYETIWTWASGSDRVSARYSASEIPTAPLLYRWLSTPHFKVLRFPAMNLTLGPFVFRFYRFRKKYPILRVFLPNVFYMWPYYYNPFCVTISILLIFYYSVVVPSAIYCYNLFFGAT